MVDMGSGGGSSTGATKSMSVFVWSPTELREASKISVVVKIALAAIVFAFLFIIIAFSTPAWLETDGELPNPKFIRIGN